MLFQNRVDAGRQLAAKLSRYRKEAPLVLGLPRDGVPVAYEIARVLGAPLEVCVVRKVGAPLQPEFGMGAVAEGGELVLNQKAMISARVTDEEVRALAKPQVAEVERRVRLFRGDRPAPAIRGRTVIIVDDGIATGATIGGTDVA
jgi:putative phosphoribosyl transferase